MTRIAAVIMPGRGDTDQLLHDFAQHMLEEGHDVKGIVQINTDCGPDRPCDMDVKVLPDGPVFRISQSLGRGARGCRLDPESLERSVAAVEASLGEGADLIVLNKFGKQEAEGRGFREMLARAVADGIPVLVGLNGLNEPAFEEFAGGMAERCEPSPEALAQWAKSAIASAQREVA